MTQSRKGSNNKQNLVDNLIKAQKKGSTMVSSNRKNKEHFVCIVVKYA